MEWLVTNVGWIVQTVVIVFSGFIALGAIKKEIENQGERLKSLSDKVDKLEGVLIVIARQDERLSFMDQRMLAEGKRIDRLEYGRRTTKEKSEENN